MILTHTAYCKAAQVKFFNLLRCFFLSVDGGDGDRGRRLYGFFSRLSRLSASDSGIIYKEVN